jgi:hypothetical protein
VDRTFTCHLSPASLDHDTNVKLNSKQCMKIGTEVMTSRPTVITNPTRRNVFKLCCISHRPSFNHNCDAWWRRQSSINDVAITCILMVRITSPFLPSPSLPHRLLSPCLSSSLSFLSFCLYHLFLTFLIFHFLFVFSSFN